MPDKYLDAPQVVNTENLQSDEDLQKFLDVPLPDQFDEEEFNKLVDHVADLFGNIKELINEIRQTVTPPPLTIQTSKRTINVTVPCDFGCLIDRYALDKEIKDFFREDIEYLSSLTFSLEPEVNEQVVNEYLSMYSYENFKEIYNFVANELGIKLYMLQSDPDLFLVYVSRKTADIDEENELSEEDIKVKRYAGELFAKFIANTYELVSDIAIDVATSKFSEPLKVSVALILSSKSGDKILEIISKIMNKTFAVTGKDLLDYIYYSKDINIESVEGFNAVIVTDIASGVDYSYLTQFSPLEEEKQEAAM